jgi:hypothetical protein
LSLPDKDLSWLKLNKTLNCARAHTG